MANVDVSTLHLKVVSTGLKEGRKDLSLLNRQAARSDKVVARLKKQFLGLAGLIGGVVSAAAGFDKFVSVNREFERLQASLITVTGNLQAAQGAFRFVSDFAKETPYDLNQSTQAFIKLSNFGLNATKRSLKSYGDTAASMGKSLDQMIEAVADATVGEFERLKEFGIKAKTEGDRVKFTFRGVTTEVAKSSGEIEDYLISLGELNFSDGMMRQMDTIGGLISNLEDQWDLFFVHLSKLGLGDALKGAIKLMIDAMEGLNRYLKKDAIVGLGGFKDQIIALGAELDDLLLPIRNNFIRLYNFVNDNFGGILRALREMLSVFIKHIVEAIRYFPQNIAALKGIITAVMKGIYATILLFAVNFVDSLKQKFKLIFEFLKVIGDKVKSLLTFETDYDAVIHLQAALSTYQAEQIQREAELLEGQKRINEATREQIKLTLLDREASILAFEEKQKMRADDLIYKQYEEEQSFKKYEREQTALKEARRVEKEEKKIQDERLTNTANFFGNLSTIASIAGTKQSEVAKRLAIIQTTIDTYKSAMAAYSSLAGIPYVGPALGAAAAAAAIAMGLAQVQAIKSTSYAGAYDRGGGIPAGKYGLVGERGPELVKGPASVISRTETSKAMNQGKPVSIMNFFDPEEFRIKVREEIAKNREVIVNIIQESHAERTA